MPRSSSAAVDVFDVFDQDADDVWPTAGSSSPSSHSLRGIDAFALVADVDEDEVVVDAEDFAFDDLIGGRRPRRRANPCRPARASPMAAFQSSSETSNSRIRLRLTMGKGRELSSAGRARQGDKEKGRQGIAWRFEPVPADPVLVLEPSQLACETSQALVAIRACQTLRVTFLRERRPTRPTFEARGETRNGSGMGGGEQRRGVEFAGEIGQALGASRLWRECGERGCGSATAAGPRRRAKDSRMRWPRERRR